MPKIRTATILEIQGTEKNIIILINEKTFWKIEKNNDKMYEGNQVNQEL